MNKWELKLDSEVITITQESENYFIVQSNHPLDDNWGMWFPSYQSARRYAKNEMGAEGRFKKIISN